MQLHAYIKVHYKVIEILAVRWLGMKLMQIFKEITTSDESYPGDPLGTNIVMEGW